MQTILKHGTAVLSRVIFIGFSVQIVLGILWMCNAFAGFTGPGEGIVCVGAMLLVGAAVWFMKRSVREDGSRWTDVFAVLSVLTFPFVMQSLVKPDIRILMTVALLVGMGIVCRLLRNLGKQGRLKAACMVCAFWMAATGLVAGTDVILNGWTPVSIRLTERIAWTTLYKSYSRLPQEIWDTINFFKLGDASIEVVGIREVLVPHLVEDLGEEQAEEVLCAFRQVAWEYEKRQIVKEIVWDMAGYTVSPLVVPLQLGGRAYESYTGRNYGELLRPAPELGKLYTTYSCWWFGVALAGAAVFYIFRAVQKGKRPKLSLWGVVALTGAGLVTLYVLDGAGRMDYKNTLFVLCTWLIWMTGGVQNEKD